MFEEREISRAFIREAEDDFDSAFSLLEKGKFSKVVMLCQSCAEKSIKAALILKKIISSEHKVIDLFIKEYSKELKEINKIENVVRFFEREGIKTRYPLFSRKDKPLWLPSESYNQRDAEESLQKAEFILNAIKNFLKDKYNV